MITRRNIRVKVMQSLYTKRASNAQGVIPGESAKLLQKHFDQTYALLAFELYVLTETARYAEADALLKASKHRPTAQDLAVPVKVAGNELVWKIVESDLYKLILPFAKAYEEEARSLIKITYNRLAETSAYTLYNQQEGRTKQAEKEIVELIYNDLMLADQDFNDTVEGLFTNWDDDAEMLQQICAAIFQKPGAYSINDLLSPDKKEFAKELLETVSTKREFLNDIIKPKLNNWDAERLAQLDLILLEMGIAEFLYFETIPQKVTINEYIDIAKAYSTPQSGQFVNGILDGLRRDLEAENKINKIAYKKSGR